jgi:hypothetical protein
MPDLPRPDAPQPDMVEARHTLSVREVESLLAEAGVQRSHRHVLRLCQSGVFDAVKIPGGPSGEEWFIAPASVPKAIGDLKQIDARRAARYVAPRPDMPAAEIPIAAPTFDPDEAGHGGTGHGMSPSEHAYAASETNPDTARHSAPRDDIYEHPYVKRLEDRCDKLEAKLDAQVRRTEEIQIRSQEKLLELQRMTAVGQSQTLAEFMLRAKDWVLGQGSDADKKPEGEEAAAA